VICKFWKWVCKLLWTICTILALDGNQPESIKRGLKKVFAQFFKKPHSLSLSWNSFNLGWYILKTDLQIIVINLKKIYHKKGGDFVGIL